MDFLPGIPEREPTRPRRKGPSAETRRRRLLLLEERMDVTEAEVPLPLVSMVRAPREAEEANRPGAVVGVTAPPEKAKDAAVVEFVVLRVPFGRRRLK